MNVYIFSKWTNSFSTGFGFAGSVSIISFKVHNHSSALARHSEIKAQKLDRPVLQHFLVLK